MQSDRILDRYLFVSFKENGLDKLTHLYTNSVGTIPKILNKGMNQWLNNKTKAVHVEVVLRVKHTPSANRILDQCWINVN